MSLKRKYVDSHWLVFAFQGVVALLFGWFTLFAKVESINVLVSIVGATLLGLGIVEMFNLLRRTHMRETVGLSFAMALLEISAAFALLFTLDMNNVYHLVIVAAYTVIRGLLEIALGIRAVDDRTDRFIWVLLGICGCVMGFVILNSGKFNESEMTNFIKIFGAYMSIFGISNLIYGVHNRDQAKELSEANKESHKHAHRNGVDGLVTMKAARSVSTKPVAKAAIKSYSRPAATKTARPAAKKTTVKAATKTTAKKTTKKATTKKTTTKRTNKRR